MSEICAESDFVGGLYGCILVHGIDWNSLNLMHIFQCCWVPLRQPVHSITLAFLRKELYSARINERWIFNYSQIKLLISNSSFMKIDGLLKRGTWNETNNIDFNRKARQSRKNDWTIHENSSVVMAASQNSNRVQSLFGLFFRFFITYLCLFSFSIWVIILSIESSQLITLHQFFFNCILSSSMTLYVIRVSMRIQ